MSPTHLLFNKKELNNIHVPVKGRYGVYCRLYNKLLVGSVLVLSSVLIPIESVAFQNNLQNSSLQADVNYQISKNAVESIGSPYQNSIKLLNNRFRVDGDIQEITIVFFREQGSPPIVLVRPDGSKLFIENDTKDDSYDWFETDSYDMVSLKEPMPGPWQAVGDILPNSRVLVIAGIALDAQAIPELVFSGEIIKQTARLKNIGSKIDISLFSDVVSLSIEFISTNNPQFPNFGLGSHQIARFEDNGLGFDEHAADGVMTGEFNLNVNEGEWRPVFTVKTPLFSREQINDNIVVRQSPIRIRHDEAISTVDSNVQNELENTETVLDDTSEGSSFHTVHIEADEEYIVPSSVVLSATVRHPDASIEKFSLTDTGVLNKQLKIANNEYGIYKVNMTVFATTQNGREVVLKVPEYSFVTSAPEIIEPEVIDNALQTDEVLSTELQDETQKDTSWIMIAIVINLFLLVTGCLLIVYLYSKRNNPNNHIGHKFMAIIKACKKPGAIIPKLFGKKAVTENSQVND